MSKEATIEREVRYKINEETKDKIIKSSKQLEKATRCIDLCMGKYGFDSLEKLGCIIRLRNKAGKCVIESKKKLDNNSWNEVKITIPSIKNGYDFLKNIGLEPYLYINRIREVRKIEPAKVYIDKLEILGTFVEFELEEGYEFEDLDKYLNNIGINSKPEKLYGDIFKEMSKDPKFNEMLNNTINNFIEEK